MASSSCVSELAIPPSVEPERLLAIGGAEERRRDSDSLAPERDDRGLLEELRPDELQLLFGNVGIFDAGDCRVVVGDLRLERVLLQCQTVGKPAQVRCHLADVVECGGKTGERRLDVRGAEDPQVARRDAVERLEIQT